jgi:hypothetical protein
VISSWRKNKLNPAGTTGIVRKKPLLYEPVSKLQFGNNLYILYHKNPKR